jgi:hypothetical protein
MRRAAHGRVISGVDAPALAAVARGARIVLILACLGALAVAMLLVLIPRKTSGVPDALRGGDGLMIVVDVSSSTLGFSDTIGRSLRVLARDPGQRAGLVLASESAYMALPPDAPSSALRGWDRMMAYVNAQNRKIAARAKLDRTPIPNPAPGDYPWVGIFTGGTRLSAGLARAIGALQQPGRAGGQIVLISDLRDPPEDLPKVAAEIARMKELGIELRIVTVGNAARDPVYFSEFGGAEFIQSVSDAVYATDRVAIPAAGTPAASLVALGVVLAAALALAEPRLPLRWAASAGGDDADASARGADDGPDGGGA